MLSTKRWLVIPLRVTMREPPGMLPRLLTQTPRVGARAELQQPPGRHLRPESAAPAPGKGASSSSRRSSSKPEGRGGGTEAAVAAAATPSASPSAGAGESSESSGESGELASAKGSRGRGRGRAAKASAASNSRGSGARAAAAAVQPAAPVAIGVDPGWSMPWGVFTLTPIKKNLVPVGWQMTRRHPKHPATECGTLCTRSRTFKSAEGERTVLRCLKWWALQGLPLESRTDHGNINKPPEDLPSMEELDSQAPTEWLGYHAMEGQGRQGRTNHCQSDGLSPERPQKVLRKM